jgi:hypothetical protein
MKLTKILTDATVITAAVIIWTACWIDLAKHQATREIRVRERRAWDVGFGAGERALMISVKQMLANGGGESGVSLALTNMFISRNLNPYK